MTNVLNPAVFQTSEEKRERVKERESEKESDQCPKSSSVPNK